MNKYLELYYVFLDGHCEFIKNISYIEYLYYKEKYESSKFKLHKFGKYILLINFVNNATLMNKA